jgi:hypothetical protein
MYLGNRCIHTALQARFVMHKMALWQVFLRIFSFFYHPFL